MSEVNDLLILGDSDNMYCEESTLDIINDNIWENSDMDDTIIFNQKINYFMNKPGDCFKFFKEVN